MHMEESLTHRPPSGTPRGRRARMVIQGVIASLALAAASGCVPSSVIGPLQHERDEREKLLTRSRQSGVSEALLNTVVPPLTQEEVQSSRGKTARAGRPTSGRTASRGAEASSLPWPPD